VFPRGTGLPSPFLIVDGHQSQFGTPFFKCIHDQSHVWIVCIGTPYGTHLWQVADTSQQNGSYKEALSKAKQELCREKEKKHTKPKFTHTDVISLINRAWVESFADVNKSALANCEWNPLNRICLLHKEVIKAMTTSESTEKTQWVEQL
jgi:hypothetical protein